MYAEVNKFCSIKNIDLVAVTKTRSIDAILNLYNQGQRFFGENRVQELLEKHERLPSDIDWHMIGNLQSKKVKYIVPFVSMIHSGSNISLLNEINKRAIQHQRTIDVLLQIKIGKEEAKSGWDKDELFDHLKKKQIQALHNVRIRGVMGMATFTKNEDIVRSEFAELKSIFDQIRNLHYSENPEFDTISMGMSGDYKIAIEEGATMVRIGSLLFQ